MSASAHRLSVRQLYQAHSKWLLGWLARRVDNRCDAADLSQDTFLRVLTSTHSPEQVREPRAYLATIAKRLLLNLYRRQSLEQAYLDALATLPEHESPSVETRAALLEALNEVDHLLARLSVKARAAFLMSQLEGYTQEEVAEALNVSVRSVQRYLLQAFEECIVLASGEWP